MVQIISVLFVLAVAKMAGSTSGTCNEDDLMVCLHGLQQQLLNIVQQGDEKDISSYCQILENGGECLKASTMSCKEEKPMISKLMTPFHAYLNQLCKDNGKLYLDNVACFENHKEEFEKCSKIPNKREANTFQEICTDLKKMRCQAMKSKEFCKNGEAYGNSMEKHVDELEPSVCEEKYANSADFLGSNIWNLFFTLLILIFMKSKLV